MNLRRSATNILCFALMTVMFSRPSAASSYCPGCAAALAGAAVAVGAGVGLAIYFVHRSHTSVTGCVAQTEHGFRLTAKDGKNYELVNAPSDVKARERLSLRGHKITTSSGRSFRVDRVSRDYGACAV